MSEARARAVQEEIAGVAREMAATTQAVLDARQRAAAARVRTATLQAHTAEAEQQLSEVLRDAARLEAGDRSDPAALLDMLDRELQAVADAALVEEMACGAVDHRVPDPCPLLRSVAALGEEREAAALAALRGCRGLEDTAAALDADYDAQQGVFRAALDAEVAAGVKLADDFNDAFDYERQLLVAAYRAECRANEDLQQRARTVSKPRAAGTPASSAHAAALKKLRAEAEAATRELDEVDHDAAAAHARLLRQRQDHERERQALQAQLTDGRALLQSLRSERRRWTEAWRELEVLARAARRKGKGAAGKAAPQCRATPRTPRVAAPLSARQAARSPPPHLTPTRLRHA